MIQPITLLSSPARWSIRSKPCSHIVKRRFPVKYNRDPPTPCLSASSSLPTHLIDALPSLATDDFLPQGDLAIRTSDGQDVPSETPRDPPYSIGEERVRVVRPVREELGRRPGRGGGRAEVDLDGSVLRRASGARQSKSNRIEVVINNDGISIQHPCDQTRPQRQPTHLPTCSDIFTGQPDVGCPRDVPHPIAMRVQGRLDLRASVQVSVQTFVGGLIRCYRVTRDLGAQNDNASRGGLTCSSKS